MNGATFQDGANFDKGTVTLYVQYISGAAGAITTITKQNGIASITHSGTGTIVVKLLEPAFELLYATGEIQQATFTAANGNWVMQKTGTDVTSSASPQVIFETRSSAANAPLADTVAGDIVQFEITVGVLAP